jgi:hypothetical protein
MARMTPRFSTAEPTMTAGEPEPALNLNGQGFGGQDSGGQDSPLSRGIEALEPDELDELGQVDQSPALESAVQGPPLTAEGLLTFDAWVGTFKACHVLPGHFLGLQTLITAPDRAEFPAAAKAIYDTIAEVPTLHFLLKPGGKWAERAAAIGLYAVPVAIAVKAEAAAKRAAKAEPKRVAAPGAPPAPSAEVLQSDFFKAKSGAAGPVVELHAA